MLFDQKLKITPHLKLIGAPFRRFDVESVGGVPLLATCPVKIANGITTTGEVSRKTDFENVKGFWTFQDKSFVDDMMLDDQSLVI